MISAIRCLRVLGRYWKLAVIGVFSLSIAMTLGVLSLSISNTALLLPLAAPDADRLVMIYAHASDEAISGISYPDYEYYWKNNHVFTDVAAVPNAFGINASLNPDTHEEVRVVTRPVSDRYFAVLGIRPYLGRLFAPGDDDAKSSLGVMTYFCWRRLGADRRLSASRSRAAPSSASRRRVLQGRFMGSRAISSLRWEVPMRMSVRERGAMIGHFVCSPG